MPQNDRQEKCEICGLVLRYIERVSASGRILTGQHISGNSKALDDPTGEREHVRQITGKYPAIMGVDFYLSPRPGRNLAGWRASVVERAREQWEQGGLVTISWHQELPGNPYTGWDFVQRAISQEEFNDILTPGSEMHGKWVNEVDEIAGYLKALQDAGVPVIWRPYHEMCGPWFWWGAKEPESFHRLWRDLHSRLVGHHGLDSLIWCWSPNRNVTGDYGDDYVDITGVDTYVADRSDPVFSKDSGTLSTLSNKPYALTETGLLPSRERLMQCGYAWFLIWHTGWCDNEFFGMPKKNSPGNTPAELRDIYEWERTITLDEVNLNEPCDDDPS